MLAPKNSLPTQKLSQPAASKDEKKNEKVPKPLPIAGNDMTPQQIANLKFMEKELKRRIGHKVFVIPRIPEVYGYIYDVVVDPTALMVNRIKWSFWYRGYVYAKGRTCIMQMAHDVNNLYPNKYRVAANPEDAHLGPACFFWNCHTQNGNRLRMLYSCLPRNTRTGEKKSTLQNWPEPIDEPFPLPIKQHNFDGTLKLLSETDDITEAAVVEQEFKPSASRGPRPSGLKEPSAKRFKIDKHHAQRTDDITSAEQNVDVPFRIKPDYVPRRTIPNAAKPLINKYDTQTQIFYEVFLPGVKQGEVKLQIKESQMHIQAVTSTQSSAMLKYELQQEEQLQTKEDNTEQPPKVESVILKQSPIVASRVNFLVARNYQCILELPKNAIQLEEKIYAQYADGVLLVTLEKDPAIPDEIEETPKPEDEQPQVQDGEGQSPQEEDDTQKMKSPMRKQKIFAEHEVDDDMPQEIPEARTTIITTKNSTPKKQQAVTVDDSEDDDFRHVPQRDESDESETNQDDEEDVEMLAYNSSDQE